MTTVFDYTQDALLGRPIRELVHPDDGVTVAELLGASAPAPGSSVTLDLRFRMRDGSWRALNTVVANLLDDPELRGIVFTGRDVTERKELEHQLAHQAFHDPLTGLANRALFTDRVEQALRRDGSRPTVLFVDLDDFKTVNDSLGHAAGDSVLQEVARRLRIAVRPTDTVARFGGDEFAVLLEGVNDSAMAADAAARILHALELAYEIDGRQVFPRASVGICLVDREDTVPEAAELLRNADVAMYMAKRDSKGSYRVFEPAMHERVVERLELRAELQRALELGQLEVYYQPVVRLDRATNCGVEALLRWNHPTRGLIPPIRMGAMAMDLSPILLFIVIGVLQNSVFRC